MLQEIASNIVMFFLGSVLTYCVTMWTTAFKKLGFVEFGVRALLRNRMIQTVNYYREKQKLVDQAAARGGELPEDHPIRRALQALEEAAG